MKNKKSIGVVIAIAILLLSITTTLGNFSPVSYAQVEQETDQTGAATTTDDVTDDEDSADKQVVEAATQDETNANDTDQQETDQTGAATTTTTITTTDDVTDDEDSADKQVVEAATQDETNANDTDQQETDQTGAQISELGTPQQEGEDEIIQAIEQGALEKAAGVDVIQQIDQVATQIANSSTEAQSTGDSEEAGASTIEQTIQQIALQTAQVGGNADQTITQLAQLVSNNPNGPVAQAIQQLAKQYAQGNTDEVRQATTQIGTQIAKGQNIQQTLVQVTNQIINNINNINTNINNYNNVKIHSTSPTQTKVIQETVNTLKAEKPLVKVPRIHIEFGNHKERNLVLRVLNTQDAKYNMPFSKYDGAFVLNDNEFKVKLIGIGKILSAAISEMKNNGDIGPREFLQKDVHNGKVFFNLDDVKKGKYLLDVYIRLTDGSIGTFARGSITIR